MKRRFALLGAALAMALTVMLPSSTLGASNYRYKIVDQHCIGSGHNIYFRVKLTAAGSTPANKLTIKSVSQYRSGGTWHTSYRWPVDSKSYTANGQSHAIDYSYTHDNDHGSRQWRIASVLKAWQGGSVLAHKRLTSMAC